MEYTFKIFIESIRYYPLKYFRETWQNTNRSVIFFGEVVSLFEYRCDLSRFKAVRKNSSSMALLIIPVRTFEIWGRAICINFGGILSF